MELVRVPLTEPEAVTPGFSFKSWVKSRPLRGTSRMVLVGMTLVMEEADVSMARQVQSEILNCGK
jgi:hypothetical protein